MTSVYGPAASHERRVKGLEQPGEDIAAGRALVAQTQRATPAKKSSRGTRRPIRYINNNHQP